MRDERLPYLFRKKNAIACVETAKYVVPLEKKTKKLFVERVDEMAKKMNATRAPHQPIFWNRAWSKTSSARRRAKKNAQENGTFGKKKFFIFFFLCDFCFY